MRDHLKRFLGFALLPGFSLLASLILLPLISSQQGPAGWSALVLGQSIGAFVSVIAGLAWPVIGGQLVASAPTPTQRERIFRLSLSTRSLSLGACLALAAPLCLLLERTFPVASMLFMAGIALNALSAAWYYAGVGTPSRLIWNEGIPRLAGYVVAIPLLVLSKDITSYATCTVTAGIVSVLLNYFSICRQKLARNPAFKDALREIVNQLEGMWSRLTQAGQQFGGPMVVALLASSGLPVFTAYDTVLKAALNATSFLPLVFVSWVGRHGLDREERRRRQNASMSVVLTACAILGGGWLIMGTTVMNWLFSGEIAPDFGMLALVAFSFSMGTVITAMELLVLVPEERAALVFRVGWITSVCGIAMLPLLCIYGGAIAAFASFSLVYLAKLLIYSVILVRSRT